MSTFLRVVNSNGDLIINTFPSEFIFLLGSIIEGPPKPIEITFGGVSKKARYGYTKNELGTIYVLTIEKKYVDSYKAFKYLINANIILLEIIPSLKKKIEDQINSQTQQLIHNLTSQNSYNIQDLFALIPQQVLSERITKQEDVVVEILKEKPKVSARTLLNLIKYNIAMKIEFSVFEKTMIAYPRTSKTENSIRKFVLSILQIFINDFDKKNITLSLEASEKILNFDSECLSVSLFYLIENAVKYCASDSKFKIMFKDEEDCFSIIFDMISLRIEANEIEKLCELNYRAENAKRLVGKGEGIGMYRVQSTLKLNDAELEIVPRYSDCRKEMKGEQFEHK
ncbi:MAG TPA: hypothetical protein PKC76_19060 [Saprospiraceae bacterium]|nr:hypothetical protein [Saprospiraceae bacterium]HMP26237.1 hypothetical protein [Saprospiraceae bacterium]